MLVQLSSELSLVSVGLNVLLVAAGVVLLVVLMRQKRLAGELSAKLEKLEEWKATNLREFSLVFEYSIHKVTLPVSLYNVQIKNLNKDFLLACLMKGLSIDPDDQAEFYEQADRALLNQIARLDQAEIPEFRIEIPDPEAYGRIAEGFEEICSQKQSVSKEVSLSDEIIID